MSHLGDLEWLGCWKDRRAIGRFVTFLCGVAVPRQAEDRNRSQLPLFRDELVEESSQWLDLTLSQFVRQGDHAVLRSHTCPLLVSGRQTRWGDTLAFCRIRVSAAVVQYTPISGIMGPEDVLKTKDVLCNR